MGINLRHPNTSDEQHKDKLKKQIIENSEFSKIFNIIIMFPTIEIELIPIFKKYDTYFHDLNARVSKKLGLNTLPFNEWLQDDNVIGENEDGEHQKIGKR